MKKTVLLLLVYILFLSGLSAQIQHLEPPFWWTGMKNPDLQLMVHAPGIADYHVKIEYPGIEVHSVSRQENPNYLFINLSLDEKTQAGSFPIEFTRGKKSLSYEYKLINRNSASSEREGFNSSDVIYLLMPDRFANGDTSNDIVKSMRETDLDRNEPYGRHGGDIHGIIDHINYLDEMGFTSLWLNPVLENDQPRASYHGYAITDFYKVDSRFGTNEDYKKLAELAKEKGIKLIMDMVFNHCGSKHWWMEDLPSQDWIHYYPDFKITNHRRTVNQDPYASESDTELMQDGWFVASMPDLNQENPFMKEYLIQNSIWWIEYLGLGGIRMDTYPYPDKYMMAEWCERVLDEYPDFNIVGEEWSTNPLIVSYWQRGQENRDGYEPHLPTVMDFPLQDAVTKALTEKEDWSTGLIKIYESLANDFIYPDPYNILIFPENHDMARFYMQVGMDKKLYKNGITFYLTTRGIPQFLYGSEILMTHTEGNSHGYIRKDFPGGWKNDKINAFTGENMDLADLEMQEFFKRLLNWRKENPVIHNGKLTHYAPRDNVYVFFRYDDNKKVMVIINKNPEDYELDLTRFDEMISGTGEGLDVLQDRKVILGDRLGIKALTPYVIEIL